MKKLFLCAVALMIASLGFAQVIDTGGEWSPTPKTVAPLSGAAVDANTGLSIQNGNDNKVWVRQAGTFQSVRTYQDDGTGTGGNLTWVMQTGSVQANSGVWNVTEVIQSGTVNQSSTKQEGDYNEAITRQGQIITASAGNKALIRQGVADQAEYNFAAIDQDGDENQARIRQTYDNSDAWTQQVGNNNKSLVLQNAGPNGTDGHYAMNEQLGDRNEAYIKQRGLGGRNTATRNQEGDDNKGQQNQITDALMGSAGNRAGMMQGLLGLNYNLVPLVMDLYSGPNPISGIDNNQSFWTSSWQSFGAEGVQIQTGHENAADMAQSGGSVGASNYGEQLQADDNNDAAMIQNHYGSGGINYAKQEQEASSNYVGLAQTGSCMKSLQTQIGNGNNALSSQRGEGHLLNVHQRGDGNYATTAQAGLENTALVVQRDGQSYSVEQNIGLFGYLNLSAGGNQADILQLGPNGNFETDGIDCYFDPQLIPAVINDIPDLIIDDICGGC